MKSLLAAALVICFAAQCGKALAYACNNNYYVNSSGHALHSPSCGQEHEKRTAECHDGSVSFLEHHRGACSYQGGVAHGDWTPPLMDCARSSLHGCPKPTPPPAGASELSLCLDAFGYNPTHLVQLTSTTSP
jgi:Protein of unknown function (DUF3761)